MANVFFEWRPTRWGGMCGLVPEEGEAPGFPFCEALRLCGLFPPGFSAGTFTSRATLPLGVFGGGGGTTRALTGL